MKLITQKEQEYLKRHFSSVNEQVNVSIYAFSLSQSLKKARIKREHFVFLCGANLTSQYAFESAKFLVHLNIDVHFFSLDQSYDMKDKIKELREYGVRAYQFSEQSEFFSYLTQLSEFSIIENLFDQWMETALSDYDYEFINSLNNLNHSIFSLALPSGLCPQSGKVKSTAIKAEKTFCFGAAYQGLYLGRGIDLSGEVEVLQGVVHPHYYNNSKCFLIDRNDIDLSISSRSEFSDKLAHGHTLVIGGSHGKVGSLIMSAQAALKVGTGLVTTASWETQYIELCSRISPEMRSGYLPVDDKKWDKLTRDFSAYDSISIGPGLGVSARSRRAVIKVLSSFQGPLVIDGDGINVLRLSDDKKLFSNRSYPTVLTPDKFELCRLIGVDESDLEENLMEHLKFIVDHFNCFVLLKGPCSYLASPSGEVFFHYEPNSGMASSGVGDVLSGILAGMLAQDAQLQARNSRLTKILRFESSLVLGLYLHSKAGLLAANQFGQRAMTAMSVVELLPKAFSDLESEVEIHA